MAQRTIVSIYEVIELAATGPLVGHGSLVNPGIVLVHPPLSNLVVAGTGPRRLRVGIYVADRDEAFGEGAEVIDVLGEPHVVWACTDAGLAVVALELRTPARSPKCVIPGVDWTQHNENDYQKIAEHVQDLSKSDPVQDLSTSDGGSFGQVEFSLWCRVFPGSCKH